KALQRGCYWIGSGSLTRTRLFTTNRFRADLPHCGDYEWFLRTIRTSRFLYYEKPLMRLRRHAGQASATNLASGRDIREAYRVIEENIARHGYETSVREAVAIARIWMLVIGRRTAAAAVRGQSSYAGSLAGWALRFLVLPLQVHHRSRAETAMQRGP